MELRTLHAALRTRKLRHILLTAIMTLVSLMQAGSSFSPLPIAGAAPSAPDPNSPFGVAGVMRWPNWGTMDQPAKAMLETGGSWVREDFVWGLIEPRQGQFNWEATDRMVQSLRANNLNILGIIGYSTNWATPARDDDSAGADSRYPPDNGKFYWYVRALVSRYKDSVKYWEIWNEPNNDTHWLPTQNGRQYAELLKVAYRAVKEVDPTAKVLSGGVTGNAIPFLEEVVAQGALDSFDILAIHTYAEPVAGTADPRSEARPEVHKMVEIELAKYRAFLQRNGRGDRSIWVTEMGWPARDWQLDDNAQADYLAQAYAQMLSYGVVDRIFWYSFKDDSANGRDSWGLVSWGAGKTDLAPRRPSFKAYSTAASLLTGVTPGGRIQLGSYAIVEGFDQAAQWSRRPPAATGTFSIATEQKRSGASSGRLQYNFPGLDQSADFAPPQPIPLQGKPVRLGLWVLGDASGNYLSAWLRDRDGELFKVRLGAMRASTDGWRYYESRINNYYFSYERATGSAGSAANGVPDAPLSFDAFRLENTPDAPAGSGTIYVDDLQSFDGPDATAVRFTRADKSVVDVLWSVDPVQVNLATGSANAQVTDRNGAARQVDAKNGSIALSVSSSPLYVVHKPAVPPQPSQLPPNAVQLPVQAGIPQQQVADTSINNACQAKGRVSAATYPDNRFFPETGHNLHGAFRRYWDQNGAIAILGYPITEEYLATSTDGKTYVQQYFQRARMEYHPENAPPYDVLLGLMGVSSTAGRSFPDASVAQSSELLTFFPETKQSIRLFRDWWSRSGGLPVFGFPISEEMQEKNPTDGKTYTVQYFERNRLELHPENKGKDGEVMLGLLGAEWLAQQTCK